MLCVLVATKTASLELCSPKQVRQLTYGGPPTVGDGIGALVDALRGEQALLILDDLEPLLRTSHGRQVSRTAAGGGRRAGDGMG